MLNKHNKKNINILFHIIIDHITGLNNVSEHNCPISYKETGGCGKQPFTRVNLLKLSLTDAPRSLCMDASL